MSIWVPGGLKGGPTFQDDLFPGDLLFQGAECTDTDTNADASINTDINNDIDTDTDADTCYRY